jgi:hypothetical protein
MWKTLDGRIVPAVAVAADGRSDPPSRQCRATGLSGLLDPAVGVENQSGRGSLAFDGHVASVQGDLGMQGLAHGPADDPAGVHAEDGGEAGPAFTGRDAGQVGKPGLTGSRRFEVAGPPVGPDRTAVAAVGRPGPTRQGGQPSQAGAAHQEGSSRCSGHPELLNSLFSHEHEMAA